MVGTDVYYKKNIGYKYRGVDFDFRVSQGTFSSYNIDNGTQRLLRTLTSQGINNYNKVFDLGCGYGPIGIILKKVYPKSTVHMVDRDALALEYSRQNAQLNNVNDVQIYGSLGYDNVREKDFNLVVSNIPAKVGEPVLLHMLQNAKYFLVPDGKVVVVVIDEIVEYVSRVLASDDIKILYTNKWPGHTVFHYEFVQKAISGSKPSSFNTGIYFRGEKDIVFEGHKINVKTAYGLSEFDTLRFETELLLDALHSLKSRQFDRTMVFNVGQGYLSIALSKSAKITEINLVDRNLEALKVTKTNLEINGFPTGNISIYHRIDIQLDKNRRFDCILGVLDEDDGPAVHELYVDQAAKQLNPNGYLIVASSSTAITRVESYIYKNKLFLVSDRRKAKGKSVIVLKKKS